MAKKSTDDVSAADVTDDVTTDDVTTDPGNTVRLRLLADCHLGKCNAVVDVPADDATAAVALGVADADPAAVAYAESLTADL